MFNNKNDREKFHSVEVSRVSPKIGEALGLDVMGLHELEIAGLLHDIGKVAVDNSILNKPSSLTTEEYEYIKKHPSDGAEILCIRYPLILNK